MRNVMIRFAYGWIGTPSNAATTISARPSAEIWIVAQPTVTLGEKTMAFDKTAIRSIRG